MVRKRLSDLLREEVKKPRESADQTESDATAQAKSSTSARKGQKSGAGVQKTQAQTQPTSDHPHEETPMVNETVEEPRLEAPSDNSESTAADSKASDSDAVETPGSKLDAGAIAELEATITDLHSKLRTSERREDELQKQILTLETSLEEQKAIIQTLQSDLAKVDQLKTELDEARTVILQLTKTNTPAQSPAAKPVPLQLSQKPEPQEPVPSTPPVANSLHQAELSSIHRSELTKVLNHPVLPSPPSSGFSNEEIGWVD